MRMGRRCYVVDGRTIWRRNSPPCSQKPVRSFQDPYNTREERDVMAVQIGAPPATRRALLRGVGGSGAAAMLGAACGAGGQGDSGAAPAASAQPVKITYGTKFGAGERAMWAKQTVDKFNEQNAPKITVEHTVLGDSVQAPELLVMLSSGTGPDVTQTSGSWFSDFAEKGALGDVT